MTKTKIEWADEVWNPVTGCSKVSQGCKNCYAETIAQRFWGERKFTDVQLHPERLDEPIHWRKPRRVFVNSMSDLFHDDVPGSFIADVLHVINHSFCNHHTFMVLTKRPDRMMRFFRDNPGEIIPNLWLGVSVENQAAADERIPLLLQTPAAVRFVSCEPMLGPVDLRKVICSDGDELGPELQNLGMGSEIDWVICGGESGPHARPMHPDWARGLRDQCLIAGVPFFFKQWGKYVPNEEGCGSPGYRFNNAHIAVSKDGTVNRTWQGDDGASIMAGAGKAKAGRVLDGRTWDEYPA